MVGIWNGDGALHRDGDKYKKRIGMFTNRIFAHA